tara:strand:+ start:1925 stop:2155 length:231 start_codon:yes stop_codon:yes gene_type:complete
MKLLITNIVANNLLGYFNSFSIKIMVLFDLSFSESKEEGVSEKKATSAPEIIAEQKSKIVVKIIFIKTIEDCSIKK